MVSLSNKSISIHVEQRYILLSLSTLLFFVFCRRNAESIFIATDILNPDKGSKVAMEDAVQHNCVWSGVLFSLEVIWTMLIRLYADALISVGCIYKWLKFGDIKILHSCDPQLDLIVECCLAAVIKYR